VHILITVIRFEESHPFDETRLDRVLNSESLSCLQIDRACCSALQTIVVDKNHGAILCLDSHICVRLTLVDSQGPVVILRSKDRFELVRKPSWDGRILDGEICDLLVIGINQGLIDDLVELLGKLGAIFENFH